MLYYVDFFLELTQSFIIPLERYFASLLSLHKYYHTNRQAPKIKRFHIEEFLRTLDQCGPQLTSTLKRQLERSISTFFIDI